MFFFRNIGFFQREQFGAQLIEKFCAAQTVQNALGIVCINFLPNLTSQPFNSSIGFDFQF